MNQTGSEQFTSRLRGGSDHAGPAFAGPDLVRLLINPRRPLQVVFDETARKIGLAPDEPVGGAAAHGNQHRPASAALSGMVGRSALYRDSRHPISPCGRGNGKVRYRYRGYGDSGGAGRCSWFFRRCEACPVGEVSARDRSYLGGALKPGGASWGLNLIHSPQMPEMEEQVVNLSVSAGT